MKRRVWPLLGALALAVLAGLAVFAYVGATEDRVIANQQLAPVYVTSALVPAGETLQHAVDAKLVEVNEVPEPNVPAGAVTSLDGSNAGLIAIADIPAGQVVFAQAFSSEQPDASPLKVPDGKAAVTVELGDPARVGAFLRPGSQIAVFATTGDAAKVKTTRLLLDRVSVLAVGPTTTPSETDQDPKSSALITIAVDQLQAEKVIHGAQSGLLYLALLNQSAKFTDSAGVSDDSISMKGTP